MVITAIGAILIKLFNTDIKVLFLIVGIMGLLSLFIIVKIKDKEPIKDEIDNKLKAKNNLKIESKEDKPKIIDTFPEKKEVKVWA